MADNVADSGTRMGEEMAGDMQGKAAAKTREYAGRAKQYAQQGYEYATDKTMQARDTAQSYIEEYPWYAVGIALGLGVLVGMMLRGGGRGDD